MESWCDKIRGSIEDNSSWQASIYMPTSLFTVSDVIDAPIPDDILDDDDIDVSNFANTSSGQMVPISHNDNDSNSSVAMITQNEKNHPNKVHAENTRSSDMNRQQRIELKDSRLLYSNLNTNIASNKVDHIDILNFLYPPVELDSKRKVLWSLYDFPSNGVFLFEGYNGIEDKERLINYIKNQAFEEGTILVTRSTNTKIRCGRKQHVIDLSCKHFGVQQSNSKSVIKFSPDKVQADGTQIIANHDVPSIRGRSRNSVLKRTMSSTTSSLIAKKNNKTTTNKCGCKFSISIAFDYNSNKWFLLKKRSKLSIMHTNHIKIEVEHLYMSKTTMSPKLLKAIERLVHSGSSVRNIQIVIKGTFNVSVSYSCIYDIRNSCINNLIDNCSEVPYGSAVEKLIGLFKNSPNVSFVYVLHNYNSGFVTYAMNKLEKAKHKNALQSLNSNISNDSEYSDSIKNWRDELSLSPTNDILVAFAWSHDEEIRMAQMFPEFLGVDVTFGVNKEKRELLLVAGIDGHKKTFTAFRCFMPSKQQIAYSWVMNTAISHILKVDTLQFNQCISCDQEPALNNAVQSSIDSSKLSFKKSKLRLDMYHFYKKQYKDNVAPKRRTTDTAKNTLIVLDRWITSWFNYVETENEFEQSRNKFMKFFKASERIIGDTCTTELYTIVNKIIDKKYLLMNHFFIDTCTFDFLGDSIVEAANNSLKSGPISVSNKMELANSGLTQLKATEAKSQRTYCEYAKSLNSTILWSQSNTAKYLTPYAEGIACKLYDRKSSYLVYQVSSNEWSIIHRSCIHSNEDKECNNAPTKFSRVRTVTIHDGYISCSCGFVQRWLMPCAHIYCILDKIENVTPSLFHIRWWKHFNYLYHCNSDANHSSTSDTLRSALSHTRENHYHLSSGKYKGCPIDSNLVLHRLNNTDVFTDDVLKTIDGIKRMNTQGVSLVKHTQIPPKYLESDVSNDDSSSFEFNVNNDMNSDEDLGVQDFCIGSQTISHFSQTRESMEDIVSVKNMEEKESNTAYNQLKPLFDQLLSSIKSNEDISIARNAIEKTTFSIINRGRKRSVGENEMTFLGEVNGTTRIEKRRKFLYEGYGNK